MLFEAAGIADILMQANRLSPAGAPLYQIAVATTQSHRVIHGLSGLSLLADHRLADLDPALPRDTVIVAGKGRPKQRAPWWRIGCAARPAGAPYRFRLRRALLLAEAGLLDGRRATTHWRLAETLQARFPRVQVENGPIYVQDGPIWTSGGVSSGFDLTLALVEDDYGFVQAREVAQDLVMFLRRPGGQAQFSRYPLNQAKSPGPIRDLQSWILENLADDLSVDRLAERVAMSPRNFTRVFTRETGISPAKFVEEGRLHTARQRLEQSAEGIEQIALATGFGNGLNLRRVFERKLQLTPSEYRERFHARNLA